jgi:hypothetical protein
MTEGSNRGAAELMTEGSNRGAAELMTEGSNRGAAELMTEGITKVFEGERMPTKNIVDLLKN